MWQRGEITVMKNLRIIRAMDACTAVRSERGASTAENVSATMVGARTVVECAECCVVRSSYAVTVGQ